MNPVWDLDPILLTLPWAGVTIRYYGLIFSAVFLGGFFLFYWQTIRDGATAEQAFDIIIPGFLGLLLGARLGHVLFYNFDYFSQNPAAIFRVWEGGLTSHGAAVGLAAALWYYARKQKLSFLTVSDRFVFSASLGAGLVRLGNFLNSEIVGKITASAWGIRFPLYDGLPAELTPARYPTQLLESAMGLLILALLLIADRLLKGRARPKGVLSALFLVLYFIGRFLVEFLKERHGPADNLWLSRGQILSLPAIVAGIILGAVCLTGFRSRTAGAEPPPQGSQGPPDHRTKHSQRANTKTDKKRRLK
ncbi:MAG: prolipoprotein diacylglyceryl transferase [Deltaproteobacteria bacterium]|jgi:prolipoprotein diacylglyceryl transferase|nr:prolipoprotein diacylglyceryl transferase [Deltaproteobacteria bacterium]